SRLPRVFPCAAWSGDGSAQCGATPAALRWVVCAHCEPEEKHLCPVHDAMAAAMNATCRRCATLGARSHACPVAVVDVRPVRELLVPVPARMLIVGTPP